MIYPLCNTEMKKLTDLHKEVNSGECVSAAYIKPINSPVVNLADE